jgi:aminoglycoside 6'-N-acetyltransferase I
VSRRRKDCSAGLRTYAREPRSTKSSPLACMSSPALLARTTSSAEVAVGVLVGSAGPPVGRHRWEPIQLIRPPSPRAAWRSPSRPIDSLEATTPRLVCHRVHVRFEPFSVNDLGHAAALFARVFNGDPWNDQWSVTTATRRLSDLLGTPRSMGVILRDTENETIAGFALGSCEQWFVRQHFFLREMCVAPELQRRGLGHLLLEALEARLSHVDQFYLMTGRNGPAESFYQHHGYVPSTRMGVMWKGPAQTSS